MKINTYEHPKLNVLKPFESIWIDKDHYVIKYPKYDTCNVMFNGVLDIVEYEDSVVLCNRHDVILSRPNTEIDSTEIDYYIHNLTNKHISIDQFQNGVKLELLTEFDVTPVYKKIYQEEFKVAILNAIGSYNLHIKNVCPWVQVPIVYNNKVTYQESTAGLVEFDVFKFLNMKFQVINRNSKKNNVLYKDVIVGCISKNIKKLIGTIKVDQINNIEDSIINIIHTEYEKQCYRINMDESIFIINNVFNNKMNDIHDYDDIDELRTTFVELYKTELVLTHKNASSIVYNFDEFWNNSL